MSTTPPRGTDDSGSSGTEGEPRLGSRPRNFPPPPLASADAAAATVDLDTSQVAAVKAQSGRKGRIFAWSLWDWGSASFNAVVTTFVFTVYLTSSSFGSEAAVSASLGWALAGAGLLIAILAPVVGQRSDSAGRRKFWLGFNTYVVVAITALLFFVAPDSNFLWFGLILLAVGNIVFEFASVNYNAMLAQVSTPTSIGKVSGLGWGMGYIGGIVLLLIVYFGFISPDVGLFGVTSENGMDVRVAMLVAAAWFGIFALPVLFAVPEYHAPKAVAQPHVGFFASYGVLAKSIAELWRDSRQTLYFLVASAVFRDGLAGVFTFGGVLAAGTFGFSPSQVIVFAIAANVVAGVATIAVGLLDDKIGPKPVIVGSLIGLVIAGGAVFAFHEGGTTVFWIFGLMLCLFVGPAQSASRSFLARIIPEGREGEVFGLYATTGRAVSFLAPTAFALFVTLGGEQFWGILGIVLVLLVGLGLLIPVHAKQGKLAHRS